MRHIFLGVLEKTIKHLPEVQVEALAKSMELHGGELHLFYDLVRKENNKAALYALHRKFEIQNMFEFLGPLYREWLSEGRFEMLPLPYFPILKNNFQGVVTNLSARKHRLSLKLMGQNTEKYGVRFLNNMFELLKTMKGVDSSSYIDHIYNLDHTQELAQRVSDRARDYPILLNHYSIRRYFKLLLTFDDELAMDVRSMLRDLADLTFEEQSAILPKKPRSLYELHNVLDREFLKRKSDPNIELQQSINLIHGYKCGDFEIEVPKTSGDLQDTSYELRHCVHTYVERVRKRECQILNLKRHGMRAYTVEVRAKSNGFKIEQFKGRLNDRTMEGPKGEKLRQELYAILDIYSDKLSDGIP